MHRVGHLLGRVRAQQRHGVGGVEGVEDERDLGGVRGAEQPLPGGGPVVAAVHPGPAGRGDAPRRRGSAGTVKNQSVTTAASTSPGEEPASVVGLQGGRAVEPVGRRATDRCRLVDQLDHPRARPGRAGTPRRWCRSAARRPQPAPAARPPAAGRAGRRRRRRAERQQAQGEPAPLRRIGGGLHLVVSFSAAW